MFTWLPLGVSTSGGIPGPIVYAFGPTPRPTPYCPSLDIPTQDIPTPKHTPAWWPSLETDRRMWKHYLPATSLVGGNNKHEKFKDRRNGIWSFHRWYQRKRLSRFLMESCDLLTVWHVCISTLLFLMTSIHGISTDTRSEQEKRVSRDRWTQDHFYITFHFKIQW